KMVRRLSSDGTGISGYFTHSRSPHAENTPRISSLLKLDDLNAHHLLGAVRGRRQREKRAHDRVLPEVRGKHFGGLRVGFLASSSGYYIGEARHGTPASCRHLSDERAP